MSCDPLRHPLCVIFDYQLGSVLVILSVTHKRRLITILSINDYPMALLGDRGGLDTILVRGSRAMTVLGYDTAIPVPMEEKLHHKAKS